MKDVSEENSRKLDRVMLLLEGDGDNNPGFAGRLQIVESVLFGGDKTSGVLTKVMIMWRLHIWVLCTMSAAAGFALREIVKLIWHI